MCILSNHFETCSFFIQIKKFREGRLCAGMESRQISVIQREWNGGGSLMRNIRKIKRIVQEYETFCCFISVLSTLAIQFDAKWFSGIFCNLIQEDYKNNNKSTTGTGVEFFCLLESFNSTKKILQCKKSFMRAMSKFKTHVRDCRPPQVTGWSQILS